MRIVLSFNLAFTVIVIVVDIKNSPQFFRKGGQKKQSYKKVIAYFKFQEPDLRLYPLIWYSTKYPLQTSLSLHCLKWSEQTGGKYFMSLNKEAWRLNTYLVYYK